MKLPPLDKARLIRRYKRFLADVCIKNDETLTIHCPNTGSMLGCAEADMTVWFSTSDNNKRKYPNTWEMVEISPGTRVGIHTGRANTLVAEAIVNGLWPTLSGFDKLRREVRCGDSRLDLLLEYSDQPDCYLEVKNVTAAMDKGIALFPDAVSSRGSRHLERLIELKSQGYRAILCFCVQRSDVTEVRPADAIDPVYGKTLRRAIASGVEVFAGRAQLSDTEITLTRTLPVHCP